MSVHQAVSHRRPVIVSLIRIADPRFFLVVASIQFGIKGCDGFLDCRPFLLTNLVLGYAGLETSFVGIRTRIADVLVAIRLGIKDGQTDTASDFGMCRIETLIRAIAVPRSTTSLNGVSDFCALGAAPA